MKVLAEKRIKGTGISIQKVEDRGAVDFQVLRSGEVISTDMNSSEAFAEALKESGLLETIKEI